MKASFLKKSAGLMATLMLLSMMLPVLAFASNVFFKDLKFHNNTVSGVVYVSEDAYGDIHDGKFLVDIAGNNGYSRVVDATYTTSDDEYSYYSFSQSNVTGATYVDLFAYQHEVAHVVDDVYAYQSVVERVYETTSGGSRGGGGGGGFSSSSNISASLLNTYFSLRSDVTIRIAGDTASIPASALLEAAKKEGATMTIENSTGSYTLPLAALDYEQLASDLGVNINTLRIVIEIKKVSGENADQAANAAEEIGGELVGTPVDFTVTASGNNQTIAINDLGDVYAPRTMKPGAIAGNPAGFMFNPANGKFTFVPTTISANVATLNSTTNSIYVLMSLDKSFSDVNGHWSEGYVEAMANRLIVEGYETGLFSPDSNITRAEFATLAVRALGLSGKTATATFSDVRSGEWYANSVAVAANAGIVNGYEDGTFRPNELINREELAAMVVRASAYAGTELNVSASQQASLLASFNDNNNVVWAQAEIAAAVNAGIINGFEDDTLRARDSATRAQAATMIQRFLENAKFID